MPKPFCTRRHSLAYSIGYLPFRTDEAVEEVWRTIPDGLGFGELLKRYPRGSEELEQIGNMMIFWETIVLCSSKVSSMRILHLIPSWMRRRGLRLSASSKRGEEGNTIHSKGKNLEYAFKRSLKWKQIRERRPH